MGLRAAGVRIAHADIRFTPLVAPLLPHAKAGGFALSIRPHIKATFRNLNVFIRELQLFYTEI
jgi:hypothetical protein